MKNDNCWWEQSPENRLFRFFLAIRCMHGEKIHAYGIFWSVFVRIALWLICLIIDTLHERWHPCLFKMAAIPTKFHNISAYSGYTVRILMAISRFLGARNPVEQSFTHKNALKRTCRPFCFSKWPLIQPILDIGLSQSRMSAESRDWGYTQVFSGEEYIGTTYCLI